jgi:uncharacterized caspase-like protein
VTLLDQDATRQAITAALSKIAAQAQPDDMVVIFLAGHGMSVNDHYYYAAGDLGQDDPEDVTKLIHPASTAEGEVAAVSLFQRSGLNQDAILQILRSVAAKDVVVILDTCYSAYAATPDAVLRRDMNVTATERIGHAAGRIVLSSAFHKAHDSGGEDQDDHGLFTSFLLRAFQGEADYEKSGVIDIGSLSRYLKKSVLARSMNIAAQLHDDSLVQEPHYYYAGSDFFDVRTVRPAIRTAP